MRSWEAGNCLYALILRAKLCFSRKMIFSYKVTIVLVHGELIRGQNFYFFCCKSIVWRMGFVTEKQISSLFF